MICACKEGDEEECRAPAPKDCAESAIGVLGNSRVLSILIFVSMFILDCFSTMTNMCN